MSESPVSVNLTGIHDVREAFRDLREYLPKSALRTSVRRAAEFMLGFLVLVAPKLTGRLARSIHVMTRKTEHTIRGRVVIDTHGNRDDPDNAFYWRFLEEGFHTRRGDFRQFPFVAHVFDDKNREAAQTVIDSVDEAITRAERRAKRAGG
jgi:hypothetical protein